MISADDLTNEEVIEAIESTLSDELHVHPSNIEVVYDSENGVLTYTITSDDAESLGNVLSDMQEDTFEEALSRIDGVTLDSYESPSDIVAEDIDSTIISVTEALQNRNENFNVMSEGKFLVNHCFKSMGRSRAWIFQNVLGCQ